MIHPPLIILGRSEAAMFLRTPDRPKVAAILSIHGRRELGVEAPGVPLRLDLGFDDVEVTPSPDDVIALQRAVSRRRWTEQTGLGAEVPPTRADAAAILRFAESIRDVDGLMLCHCGGGMSRAPAAALICLAEWRGPGAEAECVREVRRLRPGAVPHAGLVSLADELLARGEALVNALSSDGD